MARAATELRATATDISFADKIFCCSQNRRPVESVSCPELCGCLSAFLETQLIWFASPFRPRSWSSMPTKDGSSFQAASWSSRCHFVIRPRPMAVERVAGHFEYIGRRERARENVDWVN